MDERSTIANKKEAGSAEGDLHHGDCSTQDYLGGGWPDDRDRTPQGCVGQFDPLGPKAHMPPKTDENIWPRVPLGPWKEKPGLLFRAGPLLQAGDMTQDSARRKMIKITTGLIDYFPDACAAVGLLSFLANEKHNPGEEMHWAKDKSNDHADCIGRHLRDRGKWIVDEYPEPVRESTALAWRAMANLQMEIEKARAEGGYVEV